MFLFIIFWLNINWTTLGAQEEEGFHTGKGCDCVHLSEEASLVKLCGLIVCQSGAEVIVCVCVGGLKCNVRGSLCGRQVYIDR